MRFDGKTNKQKAEDLVINKLSVCETPAHADAIATIIKSAAVKKGNPIKVVNTIDPAIVTKFFNSPEGEKAFSDVLDKMATAKSGDINLDKEGENDMTVTKEEIAKMVEEAVAPVQKKLELAETIAKMDDVTKTYYQSLKDEGQIAFLKLSEESRKEIIEKSQIEKDADDETFSANGREIRKSVVGADAFEFMKAQQKEVESANKLAKSERDKRQLADFMKQAELQYPNLPGDEKAKGEVMKALKDLPKETRETISTMLKSGNEAIETASLFKEIGSGGTPVTDGSALSKLNKMAIEKAKSGDMTEAEAYNAVLETPEGSALYQESLEE